MSQSVLILNLDSGVSVAADWASSLRALDLHVDVLSSAEAGAAPSNSFHGVVRTKRIAVRTKYEVQDLVIEAAREALRMQSTREVACIICVGTGRNTQRAAQMLTRMCPMPVYIESQGVQKIDADYVLARALGAVPCFNSQMPLLVSWYAADE